MSSALKFSTWGISALLHAGLALSFVTIQAGSRSFEAGDGTDILRIEQGIAIEGLSQLGEIAEVEQAAQETPVEAQAAVAPQMATAATEEPQQEIKPTEPPPEIVEKSEVIASKVEPVEEQEILRETPPPVEPVRMQEVAAVEPVQQVVVAEEKTSSANKKGGDASLRAAYLGKLRGQIERKKIKPNSDDTGTVVVRFTVDAKGNLVANEIASSSGSRKLDEAALAAIQRSSPFPPFPNCLGSPTMVVSVPFRFITR